jgi:hypothetical protein
MPSSILKSKPIRSIFFLFSTDPFILHALEASASRVASNKIVATYNRLQAAGEGK